MKAKVHKMENRSRTEEVEKEFCFDIGTTIESSGLFHKNSAFIPVLTILSGPALGKEIPLIHKHLTLGRGSDCDIMIPDPAVSRKHLQISCRRILKNGHYPALKVVLRDLGSRNGTQLNYARVRRAVLKPGDKITLGRVILKYDHRDIAEQGFYDEIYRLATTDSLTALLNKASILRCLSEEIAGSARYRRRVSVILVDVDGFKSLNDLSGHLAGDQILQSLAHLFSSNLRKRDRVGRFGGDEFLIVLPETGSKGAARLAERIRQMVEKSIGRDLGLPLSVTASMGVSSGCAHKITPENLLEQSDVALYRAKALGRNRIEIWGKSFSTAGIS
jgi:diguanylate cyclase (GGDEF)-like protein